MATKTRLNSGNFRIQFRVKGLKSISKTFSSEQDADEFHHRINQELNLIESAQQSKLPIDMAGLFNSLHPDLKQHVHLLPIFGRVIGDISGTEMTLAQLIDEFIIQYNKKDQNVLHRLRWWCDNYGHLMVIEMSEACVRHGINKILAEGSVGKRGSSPQTTNRFKANLSSVFEFGKERFNLKNNPCSQIKSKPEGKGRKRYLTIEELQRLLAAAKQSRWEKFYLLILLAITCGARRGELSKLRWSDIDWDTSQIIFRDTKNGSNKRLPLTEGVMVELKKFREIGNGLVFANPRNPSRLYDFRSVWNIALQQSNIKIIDDDGEKVVFHTIRHSFCSSMGNSGVALHEIAALAGHKSIQTTMRYTHSDQTRLANAVLNTFRVLDKRDYNDV